MAAWAKLVLDSPSYLSKVIFRMTAWATLVLDYLSNVMSPNSFNNPIPKLQHRDHTQAQKESNLSTMQCKIRAMKEYASSVVSVSIFNVSKYTFTSRDLMKKLAGVVFKEWANFWEMYSAGK